MPRKMPRMQPTGRRSTGWNQNPVIYGNDSSSSSDSDADSDSDVSSALTSSPRSAPSSPAPSISYHGDDSEEPQLSSAQNSDPDITDNNSVDSDSSGGSDHSNSFSQTDSDSDNAHSSRSNQSDNSDVDDTTNNNLSVDGSFAPSEEATRSQSPALSDQNNSPVRALPSSLRAAILGVANLYRDFQRAPTPRYGVARSSSAAPSVDPRTESDSSENESESFNSESRTKTKNGASISRTSAKPPTVSFECSVCLENLDAPASIHDVMPDPAGPDNSTNQVDPVAGPSRGAGTRGRARGGRRGSPRSKSKGPVSPTDIVATHCGHLYHQLCLEKWFTEQGKRSCPSCRKNVPASKQYRLYPNISVDNSKGRITAPNEPGPSTSSAGCSAIPVRNASAPQVVEDSANNGGCAGGDCQDLKIIHNTLINDYNELQTRVGDLRDNGELKDAQIRSLEEDNARQLDEIQRLKRQILESGLSRVGVTTNKRRRQ